MAASPTRALSTANSKLATSGYIIRDTGICSPRGIKAEHLTEDWTDGAGTSVEGWKAEGPFAERNARPNFSASCNSTPCTADLFMTSRMHLPLFVRPLALPHRSEEQIQVVDLGESGRLLRSHCKGYFVDQGRQFICNLCGSTDETPRDYDYNLGPDGRRRDAGGIPELYRGMSILAGRKEYMEMLADVASRTHINVRVKDLPTASGLKDKEPYYMNDYDKFDKGTAVKVERVTMDMIFHQIDQTFPMAYLGDAYAFHEEIRQITLRHINQGGLFGYETPGLEEFTVVYYHETEDGRRFRLQCPDLEVPWFVFVVYLTGVAIFDGPTAGYFVA